MPTPAILNISSPAKSQATSQTENNKPALDNANGGFNQMLSRQLAERRDTERATERATQARPAPQTTASKTTVAEPKPAETSKASNENTDARERKQAIDESTASTPTATATELMSQVAAAMMSASVATSAAQVRAEVAPPSDGKAQDELSLTSALLDSATEDSAAADSKQAALSDTEPTLVGTELKSSNNKDRDNASVKGDFSASLRQATEPLKTATASTTVAASAADIAADKNAAKAIPELAPVAKLQDAATLTTTAPTQASALHAPQVAATAAADHLAPRFGSTAWDQAVGQKVVWMVAGAQQSASLSLNPPDLGPLQIVLNVNNGQADASFFSAQPEVRQALEAAMPKLREMMSEAGVTLGQASVSADMPERHDQAGNRTAANNPANTRNSSEPDLVGTTTIPNVSKTGGLGLVDTFA